MHARYALRKRPFEGTCLSVKSFRRPYYVRYYVFVERPVKVQMRQTCLISFNTPCEENGPHNDARWTSQRPLGSKDLAKINGSRDWGCSIK